MVAKLDQGHAKLHQNDDVYIYTQYLEILLIH